MKNMIQTAAAAMVTLSADAATIRDVQLWQDAWDACKNSDQSIDRNTCIAQYKWLYGMNEHILEEAASVDVHGVDYLFEECFHNDFDPKNAEDLECVRDAYKEYTDGEVERAIGVIKF